MTAKSNQTPLSTSKKIKEPFHPRSLLRLNYEHDLKFTRNPSGIRTLIQGFPGQAFDKKRNAPLYPPPPVLILPRATVNAHFVLNAFLEAKGLLAPVQGSFPPSCACPQAGVSSSSYVGHWPVFPVSKFVLLPGSRKVVSWLWWLGGKQLLLLPRGVRDMQVGCFGTLLGPRGAWLKLIPCVLS